MNNRRPTKDRLTAVIDIGSNSVRLVVFKGLKRTPDVLFNERVLCGLGTAVAETGRMDEAALDLAKATLKRFTHLCKDMAVDTIRAVATAAVRDSGNGPDFVKWVEDHCGFSVEVLPGKKEAKLSAYGVFSGFPGARGVVGDLGGGSLELIAVEDGKILERNSLPIGPVSLQGQAPRFTADHVFAVKRALGEVKWLKKFKKQPFYMVGGAWRTIANLHIVETRWPMRVLHGYEVRPRVFHNFCENIASEHPKVLTGMPAVPAKRAQTLPLSAVILMEVMDRQRPSKLITSGYGIREGLMYKELTHKVREQNPLVVLTREFSKRYSRFDDHGDLLANWIAPIFPDETARETNMRLAICNMADIVWSAHPDFKGELAFTRALVARYVDVTHKERAQIALALFIVYGGSIDAPFVARITSILSDADKHKATAYGLAVRLGQRLTGGTGDPLRKTFLSAEDGAVRLTIPEGEAALDGEVVRARLTGLGTHLGLTPEVRIGD